MHPRSRRPGTSRFSLLAAAVLAVGVTAWAGMAKAGDAAPVTASASSGDATLKALLQKRLLLPDTKSITLGPPSPGPFPGVDLRTVTVTSPDGQKAEVEVFSDATGAHGIIAQRYAVFDSAHPWEKVDVKQINLKDRPTLGPENA